MIQSAEDTLHWLPVTARIQLISLTLAYMTVTKGTCVFKCYDAALSPSQPLCSSDERFMSLLSLSSERTQSKLFSIVVFPW